MGVPFHQSFKYVLLHPLLSHSLNLTLSLALAHTFFFSLKNCHVVVQS